MASHDKRKFGLKARELMGKGVVTKQGLPKTLQAWVAEKLLQATLETTSINATGLEVLVNLKKGAVSESFEEIMIFPADTAHELASMMDPRSLGVTEGLTKTIDALKKHLLANGELLHNVAKLTIKGVEAKNFSAKVWVRGAIKESALGDLTPVLAGALGDAWVLHHKKWAFRCDASEIPAIGMGTFVRCLSGCMLFMLWPMSAVARKGSHAKDVKSMLMNMTQEDAAAFMTTSGHHATMRQGATLWVPYGYQYFMISLEDDTSLLVLPWQSKLLVEQIDATDLDQMIAMHAEASSNENHLSILSKTSVAAAKFLSQFITL